MAQRPSAFEDVMDFASKLPLHASVALVVLSFLILQGLAEWLSEPAAPATASNCRLPGSLIGVFAVHPCLTRRVSD
jgi:hypothetical protein